ncbi:MarR family winged helix-turn-helix transcriptional regulator [Novosphingobium cyanobacteriorum]|uniref:MarR family winged helix-turn-helix transcriptional regulator n=1 Tax=Novosphingobium cyanobacteriorum TaxID=3024215 RepID=A0ABT6CEJ2_9SPHN|nr:MarR family winged helix-turn-helix transcriptional regulator [Novosphingobium cyanobacteriorum]MDF8332221.1 MarR family winged helix-turn-helix transcriptional regulator [Novosphingobium cyanobacteriorum]
MTVTSTDILRLRARKLIASANELLAIARELEHISAVPEGTSDAGQGLPALPEDHPHWLELARRAYADRRRRAKLFDPSLFGEPAWDMLLDLFIAAKEGKRVSVTSACIGADVPATTALRWIAVLESQGLVVRESDPKDARRAFIHLTATAYSKMIEYLSHDVPVANDAGEHEAA